MVQTQNPSSINGVNLVHTCFVQVPLQLHRRLHLHVVLEDAAAERGLVVGLASRGLDGRFHPGLRHAGGDDPDAPHGFVVFRPVRHGVRLFRAEPGAGETSRNETSERIEGLGPVHMVRVKVRVERPDDGRERVACR